MKISTAKSYKSRKWLNQDLSWQDFETLLRNKTLTRSVTRLAYDALTKEEQLQIKDAGGFVGGWFKNSQRNAENILCRSCITLDLDNAAQNYIDTLNRIRQVLKNVNTIIYPTFKSTKEKPRLRIIIELSHELPPEQYEPVARKIAGEVGIDMFDPAGFRASQLMFFPAYTIDAETRELISIPGHALDADQVLKSYTAWDDPDEWPQLRDEHIGHRAQKVEDPMTKPWPIGAFNRVYSIADAIAKFLPDVYEPAGNNRYHLKGSNSTAGAVIYEGKFLYSNHAKDCATGHSFNAFDLVRMHKFGKLDTGAGSNPTKTESFKKMQALVEKDPRCVENDKKYKAQQLIDDFKDVEATAKATDLSWLEDLDYTDSGKLRSNPENLIKIIKHDEGLKNIKYDVFQDQFFVAGPLPWRTEANKFWRERDLSSLYAYIANKYHIDAKTKIIDVLTAVVTESRAVHPILEYLNGLTWDGEPRLDTLFIDYLGADDNAYTRAVTRKIFTAGVARIFEPGIKFDQILVLAGPQGIGKSTIFKIMGKKWFSDALTVTDMQKKDGAEKLLGYWLLEIPELTGLRKAESETVKSFLSRQNDIFRPAYGHTTEVHPRQCIIFGTTNEEDGFLRDRTGNRRYWIIRTPGGELPVAEWQLPVDQLWAEAIAYYRAGEDLYIESDILAAAEEVQRQSLEHDELEGVIEQYLNIKLPDSWPSLDLPARIDFLDGTLLGQAGEAKLHHMVTCPIEIWCECLRKNKADINRFESNRIIRILLRLGWKRTGTRRLPLYGKQKIFSCF